MKKIILTIIMAWCVISCATSDKLKQLSRQNISADIMPSEDYRIPFPDMAESIKDTTTVSDPVQDKSVIMNAIRDENGEMIATDVIQAAMVTARFRNVAERHGKIDISFDLSVPEELLDSDWQLRFKPKMSIEGEIYPLDSIWITGEHYRLAQLKGYQQYERFLKSIAADSSRFLNSFQLDIFLKRNLKEVYRMKNDSSYVTDNQFQSLFGVTGKQAAEHYINKYIVRRNARKIAEKEDFFHKHVKVPIITEGLRLDSLITDKSGKILYRYSQTIHTRPRLKKVSIVLSGSIYQEDKRIYSMPESQPLVFYISSLSSLADNTERYLNKVIYRKVEAHTACYIDFAHAEHQINPQSGNNPLELGRIEKNLKEIAENELYDLDSIIVTASCSPEGSFQYNEKLSEARANSASDYFEERLRCIYDSLDRAMGKSYDLSGKLLPPSRPSDIRISYRNVAENWDMLDKLVDADSVLSSHDKEVYHRLGQIGDYDLREESLSGQHWYKHLRENLYPRVRTVRFAFHLHRKNMLQDTIHTTELDTVYMKGIQALKNRDYPNAVRILRPYKDFNTAVAYCAMDYNASAENILEALRPDGKTRYMLAILYSRKGEYKKAFRYYMEACRFDPAYRHRGNLDPEISELTRRFGPANKL